MSPAVAEAIRSAVESAFRGRVVAHWQGEPAGHSPDGVTARLDIVSDVARGLPEVSRVPYLSGLREVLTQRREVSVGILLSQDYPGESLDGGALALRLQSRAIRRALAAAGVEIVGSSGVRSLTRVASGRVLPAEQIDVQFHYTDIDDGMGDQPIDWIESAPIEGEVT